MTDLDKRRKQTVCIASLLCLLSFLLLIHFGYEYKSSKTNEIILEDAKKDALQKADSAIKNNRIWNLILLAPLLMELQRI